MKSIRTALKEFDFTKLFIEDLGWDSVKVSITLDVDNSPCTANGFAQKKGFTVYQFESNGALPGSAERSKIQRALAKKQPEHIAIFTDAGKSRQVWKLAHLKEKKQAFGSEISYFAGRPIEHLARKIEKLAVSFAEEESLTLSDVHSKTAQALLAERVTKKFFKEFSDQRKAFVKFLDWIEDESKRDWYCSVLLNRLMFIYFLGGKGFLPGGTAFLTNNLAKNIKDNGSDRFYTHFLLPLSFFGLGEKKNSRGRFEETFKGVLYLDGGLFTVHQVERELGLNKEAVEKGVFPAEAKIPDIEFKRWFDYFDKWRWTLDEDKVENDGYISPHILGYIFEKYINQKQMGAYYTKEDITGYICRNTIIPRLFDMLAETGEKGKKSVRPLPVGPHPNLLNDGRGISDGEGIDRYIYASVKQEAKLPTETDYEQEQRRKRYEGILEDFDAEKIQGIDDFITYNLDIEKLALDFVSNIQDPEVLHAFYFKGLQQITVLDPTCGSGAFLFEALIIMYPLYNACLSRMRYLVGKATGDEPDVVNWGGRLHFDDLDVDGNTLVDLVQGAGTGSKLLDDLRAEVERINDHPSAEYYIKKSIIVNNLFGVDIMEEAVEICKLRLFLTLIATVERDDSKDNLGVEPLPDIDFNILAGNTLVGYTSIDRRKLVRNQASATAFDFDGEDDRLKDELREYGKMLAYWKGRQLGDHSVPEVSKERVLVAAEQIRPRLDEDLFKVYKQLGLLARVVGKKLDGTPRVEDLTGARFKQTHEPFHWLLEFPAIEARGGFDVIVGNPPYVEYTKVDSKTKKSIRDQYRLVGVETETCGNLYAFVVERSFEVLSKSGRFSMILPISSTCTQRMAPLQQLLEEMSGSVLSSHYGERPSKLFTGAEVLLSIIVTTPSSQGNRTTPLRKWKAQDRDTLFDSLFYSPYQSRLRGYIVPKLTESLEDEIVRKVFSSTSTFEQAVVAKGSPMYYRIGGGRYWKIFTSFSPKFILNGIPSTSSRQNTLSFASDMIRDAAVATLSSSLFYWYFVVTTNGRDLNPIDLAKFPLCPSKFEADALTKIASLGNELMVDYEKNSVMKHKSSSQTGEVVYQEFYGRQSKFIIDNIDEVLGQLLGFTDQEVAFIQSYELKFRMGDDDELGDGDDD